MYTMQFQYFITYDEIHAMGFGCGFTDLSYWIDRPNAMLHIKKHDQESGKSSTSEYTISETQLTDKSILGNFLINQMSYRFNFIGTPDYEASPIISKEEFNDYLRQGIAAMNKKKQQAIQEAANNPIIEYCKSIHLDPNPEGSGLTNWVANCASRRNHTMWISTKSNQWGCGYCCKKGTLEDLKEWIGEMR